jgi:hypothetical protein
MATREWLWGAYAEGGSCRASYFWLGGARSPAAAQVAWMTGLRGRLIHQAKVTAHVRLLSRAVQAAFPTASCPSPGPPGSRWRPPVRRCTPGPTWPTAAPPPGSGCWSGRAARCGPTPTTLTPHLAAPGATSRGGWAGQTVGCSAPCKVRQMGVWSEPPQTRSLTLHWAGGHFIVTWPSRRGIWTLAPPVAAEHRTGEWWPLPPACVACHAVTIRPDKIMRPQL